MRARASLCVYEEILERLPYCIVEHNEGSGKSVRMWRPTRAITARLHLQYTSLFVEHDEGSGKSGVCAEILECLPYCIVMIVEASLCVCADLPEPSLLAFTFNTLLFLFQKWNFCFNFQLRTLICRPKLITILGSNFLVIRTRPMLPWRNILLYGNL